MKFNSMKMKNYWCKTLYVSLYLIVFASVACQGQRNKKEVVYRDYTHMEADLLDSCLLYTSDAADEL